MRILYPEADWVEALMVAQIAPEMARRDEIQLHPGSRLRAPDDLGGLVCFYSAHDERQFYDEAPSWLVKVTGLKAETISPQCLGNSPREQESWEQYNPLLPMTSLDETCRPYYRLTRMKLVGGHDSPWYGVVEDRMSQIGLCLWQQRWGET